MLKGEVVRTTASLIAIVSVAIGAYIYLDSQKKGIEKKIELLDDKIKLVQKKIEGNENKVLFSSEITKNNNSILDLKTSVEDLNSRFTAIENKQHIPIVEAPKDKRSSTFIDLSASDIALRSSDKNLKEAALQKWGGNVQLLKRSGNYCMGLSDDSATIVEMDVENSPKEWSLNLSYVLKGSGFTGYGNGTIIITDTKGKLIKLNFFPFAGKVLMEGVDSKKVGRGSDLFVRYSGSQLTFGIGGNQSGEHPNFEFGGLSRIKAHTGTTGDKRVKMWIRRITGTKL
jgi:hypothetical protein